MTVANGIGVKFCDLDFITGLVIGDLVIAQALQFEVGCLQVRVRYNQHASLGDLLYLVQCTTLFIQQIGGYIDGDNGPDLGATILDGCFFQQAQN